MSKNKELEFTIPKEILKPNELNVATVVGETLPEAWEKAVLKVMETGCSMPTMYDGKEDPESKAVTMIMAITNPLKEPRIHKSLPEGIDDLWMYVREVVDGINDYKVGVGEGKWPYTYHQRIFSYPQGVDSTPINQFQRTIDLLVNTHYTRRAQFITWDPDVDLGHSEPPCFQRAWFQIVHSGEDLVLEMNTHWRSRDAFKGANMNIFAFIYLQECMAEILSERIGKKVEVGRYVDITDNFHIYGSYLRRGEMDGFLHSLKAKSFEERTMSTKDPLVQELFAEGEKRIKENLIKAGLAYTPRLPNF